MIVNVESKEPEVLKAVVKHNELYALALAADDHQSEVLFEDLAYTCAMIAYTLDEWGIRYTTSVRKIAQ